VSCLVEKSGAYPRRAYATAAASRRAFPDREMDADAKKLAEAAERRGARRTVKSCQRRGRDEFFRWMENLEPWLHIFAQLWWGHQIPAWSDRTKGVRGAVGDEAREEAHEAHARTWRWRRDPGRARHLVQIALWPFRPGWPTRQSS